MTATPQGSIIIMSVPFAGRRQVGCKTSARWAACGAWLMVFPPTAPWWSAGLLTPHGQWRAFRWTASGGMQDLGTLGGSWSYAYGVSADGSVVVGWARNAAGQGRAFRWTAAGGMQDLGTLGGGGAMLMVFPPTAPWWSAGLTTPQGRACLSLDGVWVACKTSARWAAMRAGLMVFPPTAPWWSAGLATPQGSGVPFAGRRLVGCKTSARWAAVGAVLMVFPPTAPWWSASLRTPQGSGVPFAGRRRVAWKT
jgi:probable HAF family extracellular repeat protein